MSPGLLLKKIRDVLVGVLEKALMVAVFALVVVVLLGVFSRYITREQIRWTEELARVLLIQVALLGAAAAYAAKAHLGVDYFVGKFDPSAQKLNAVIVHLAVVFFSIAALGIGGGRMVMETFANQQSLAALGILKGWVYLCVPVTGAFMTLFAARNIVAELAGKEAGHE